MESELRSGSVEARRVIVIIRADEHIRTRLVNPSLTAPFIESRKFRDETFVRGEECDNPKFCTSSRHEWYFDWIKLIIVRV